MDRMTDPKPHQPFLLDIYYRYVEDADTVAFIRSVCERYNAGTLERLVFNCEIEIRRAAVLSLGFIGDYASNHTVGQALQDEDDTVRQLAEKACRNVWNRDGSEEQRRQLAGIVRLNAFSKYPEAIESVSALIDDAPWFAEAWYQRGSACFQLDDLQQAIRDWHQTLEINPYQFVAATAMGDAYLRLKNPASALDAFRRALRLNPDLERVRSRVVELARQVGDE